MKFFNKKCAHGEKGCLGGRVDYAGIKYEVLVCVNCAKVFFMEDNSVDGNIYVPKTTIVNGIQTFEMVLNGLGCGH